MNAVPMPTEPPDESFWQQPAIREILAARDIRAIYQQLRRIGFSQQRIGALTGHSQPEVSAILRGHRVIVAYDVLERICTGLRIPRGYLGLAYSPDEPQTCLHPSPPSHVRAPHEQG